MNPTYRSFIRFPNDSPLMLRIRLSSPGSDLANSKSLSLIKSDLLKVSLKSFEKILFIKTWSWTFILNCLAAV